jgi:hypothetical protein
MNAKRLVAPVLAALAPLAACSSAPDGGEPGAHTASALDPTQVTNATYYNVTLSKVHVNRAVEPYQAGNMVNYGDQPWPRGSGGIPGYAPNASISQTPGGGQCNTYDSMVWTPDTAFQDAAQLGVKVTQTIPGPQPYNESNPYVEGCVFGGSATTGATFQGSYCSANAFNETFTNGQLTINFYVNPGDKVALAVTLDNVEKTDVTAVQSQVDNSLSTDLKNFGDTAALYGGLLSATGGDAAGAIIALIGASASVAGDLFNVGPADQCSAASLARYATSCTGGLAGAPVPANPACSSGWPNATTALQGCSFAAPPPDLLRIVDPSNVDPSTGKPSDLTAERLASLTATGPVTFEFRPTFDLTNTYATPTWYAVPRGSTSPGLMAGCASDVTIDVTIARQWTMGAGSPAAFAKSGDMAVVRTPGTLDTFAAVESGYTNQLVHDWGQGTSFASEVEVPAQSLEESGVSVQTIPAVVSRDWAHLDMFYVDGSGGVNAVFQAAPDYAWHTEVLSSPLTCIYRRLLPPICLQSLAQPNGYVTAAARTPDNLDVFFTGRDGNVYTTYWNSGVPNTAGLPTWAAPFPTTTGPCVNTNGSCAGTASPGGGIASVSRMPGELDVFYVGNDGGIWTSYWNAGWQWTTEEIYGPSSQIQPGPAIAPAGAVITATARSAENLDVFVVGLDGGVVQSTWSAQNNHWGTSEIRLSGGTGQKGGPISAVSRQPGALDVVYYGATSNSLEWATWQNPAASWSVQPIAATQYGVSTSMIGRGGVSIVAPTSYSLQAFYLNGFHQENTVAWADVNQCNTVAGTPCTPSTSAWTGEMTLPQP